MLKSSRGYEFGWCVIKSSEKPFGALQDLITRPTGDFIAGLCCKQSPDCRHANRFCNYK